jgi:hypothetical protein
MLSAIPLFVLTKCRTLLREKQILKQEVSKCKKVSDFFTKNENATTSCDTNRTNVDMLSELNMAPIEVPMQLIESEVQDVDTVTSN